MLSKRNLILAAAALALAACGQKPAATAASDTLVIAATPVPHAEILEVVRPILAKKGVKLEVKVFNDYVQPNLQVDQKQLDVNYFQTAP